jgi:hypothetical protein
VWTQKRMPASPIAHQTIGLSMKACTETVGSREERSSAGARRGAGLSDLCAESVRARARVEGYVRARAVRRSLWSGRLTAARQGRCRFNSPIFFNYICLSGELIPTESISL